MENKIRHDVFLAGKKLDLCVLTEDHALHTDWYNWFNDEESNMHNSHHLFPNTPAKQLAYYKAEIENARHRLQLAMVDKEGCFFGVISLSNINYYSQHAELGIMVGLKQYRVARYTLEGFSLLIKHAFNSLNLQRLYTGTHTKQLADFYVRGLGFSHEGIMRNHVYKNKQFIDCYLVSILKDEYLELEFDV